MSEFLTKEPFFPFIYEQKLLLLHFSSIIIGMKMRSSKLQKKPQKGKYWKSLEETSLTDLETASTQLSQKNYLFFILPFFFLQHLIVLYKNVSGLSVKARWNL